MRRLPRQNGKPQSPSDDTALSSNAVASSMYPRSTATERCPVCLAMARSDAPLRAASPALDATHGHDTAGVPGWLYIAPDRRCRPFRTVVAHKGTQPSEPPRGVGTRQQPAQPPDDTLRVRSALSTESLPVVKN